MFIVRNFVAVVFNCLPPRSTPNILPPFVMSPIYICDVTNSQLLFMTGFPQTHCKTFTKHYTGMNFFCCAVYPIWNTQYWIRLNQDQLQRLYTGKVQNKKFCNEITHKCLKWSRPTHICSTILWWNINVISTLYSFSKLEQFQFQKSLFHFKICLVILECV